MIACTSASLSCSVGHCTCDTWTSYLVPPCFLHSVRFPFRDVTALLREIDNRLQELQRDFSYNVEFRDAAASHLDAWHQFIDRVVIRDLICAHMDMSSATTYGYEFVRRIGP